MVLPHKGGSLRQVAVLACPRGCRVAVTSVPPLSSSLGGDMSPGPSPGCGAVSGPAWRTGSLLGAGRKGQTRGWWRLKGKLRVAQGKYMGTFPGG